MGTTSPVFGLSSGKIFWSEEEDVLLSGEQVEAARAAPAAPDIFKKFLLSILHLPEK
jgi:hypothetical protein